MDTENDLKEMEALADEVASATQTLREEGTKTLEALYAEFRAIDAELEGLPQKLEQPLLA